MIEKYKDILPLFYDEVVKTIFNSGKVSHAYLLETKSYPDAKNLAIDLAKSILIGKTDSQEDIDKKICAQIDEGVYNDYYFIERQGAFIKKEQLLALQDEFKMKSVYNGIRLYVIYEVDKLNKAASNTILKFLEEPESNIVALLVSKNRYQVLPTILSRCQLITLPDNFNEQDNDYDEEKMNLIMDFISDLTVKKEKIIGYLEPTWISLFKSKDDVLETLRMMQQIFIDMIYFKETNDKKYNCFSDNFLMQKMKVNDIIKKLSVIDISIIELQYNVNLKLWCDKFLLDLAK